MPLVWLSVSLCYRRLTRRGWKGRTRNGDVRESLVSLCLAMCHGADLVMEEVECLLYLRNSMALGHHHSASADKNHLRSPAYAASRVIRIN